MKILLTKDELHEFIRNSETCREYLVEMLNTGSLEVEDINPDNPEATFLNTEMIISVII